VSAEGIGYLIGVLLVLVILVGLLVGGILLVISSRKNARRAREHAQNLDHATSPTPSRGTGKLIGGIIMIVIGALGLLGQCANAVNRSTM
jgi:ABC-type nickel/cobalt efflux system permease component RcnA